jgi:hypothetical protein
VERTIAAKAMIGGRTSAGLEMTAASREIAREIAAKRTAGRAIAGSADEDEKARPECPDGLSAIKGPGP